jgi:hypothetical protein
MEQSSDSITFELRTPFYIAGYPRVWGLILGTICVLSGLFLLCSVSTDSFWGAKLLSEPLVAGLIAVLFGTFLIARSAVSDLLSIYDATFSKNGVKISWSTVPNIFSRRMAGEKMFYWGDLNSLTWIDTETYPSVCQQIKIQFKENLGLRKRDLKIEISSNRNYERCELLATILPEYVTLPHWLRQAKQSKSCANTQVIDIPMHP